MLGLALVIACALRAASPTAIRLSGPATAVQPFAIHGITFGMDKATVTNLNSRYPMVAPPDSQLDVVSYRILSLPEEQTKVGLRRPGVVIEVVKSVFFNHAGEVVAVEMVFTNLDLDKRRFILDSLDRKYETLPDNRKDFWRYSVNNDIVLESTAVEITPQRVVEGAVMPAVYTLKNLYFDKTLYRAAHDETRKSEQLYNLL